MTTPTFLELGVSSSIADALSAMGFEAPTPVQAACIPAILEGRDLAGQAQTGTGKTAAFGIPLLQKIDIKNRAIQTVIQCPTRELAIQVTSELLKMGKFLPGLQVVPVYGGQPIGRQINTLERGAHVLVGTPGRTLDHLRRGTLKLDQMSMLVFDEADEMLNMGFREDMEALLEHVAHPVQTIMFSATFPPFIREVMKRFMKDPASITVERTTLTAPDIRQFAVEVRDSVRTEAICRFMDVNQFKLGIVFCNTRRTTEFLMQDLQSRGFACEVLNGDLNQPQRDKVMNAFRSGRLDLLVATDVAARGIDVDDVDVVFNYELPTDPEYYVHRIGRTGRAGKAGTSITFYAPNRTRQLRSLERQIKVKLEPLNMPSVEQVNRSRVAVKMNELQVELEKGGLRPLIDQIEAFISEHPDYTTAEVAAALLRLRLGNTNAQEGKEAEATSGPSHHNDANKITLKFSIGRDQGVKPGDLVGAITGESGISSQSIGHINILKFETFVDVESNVSDRVIRAMERASIKGQSVSVSVAPPRSDRGGRDDGGGQRKGSYGKGRGGSGKSYGKGPGGPKKGRKSYKVVR